MNTSFLLNIVMPAFNHDKYITQAIESVLMQQCDFKYQLIIGEDCSSDNTRQICEKYQMEFPDKILVLKNERNSGLIRNYKNIFDACTAKYVAILESDDYWTDPLKLKSQVEIMEANSAIGLVHTRSATLYQNGELKINSRLKQSQLNYHDLYAEILLGRYRIVPLTACFRRTLLTYVDFDFCLNNGLKTIDAFLWPIFAIHAKIYFVNHITGHYRNLNTSVSNSDNFEKVEDFSLNGKKILNYYFDKYPIPNLNKQDIFENNAYFLAYKSLEFKNFRKAIDYSSQLKMKKLKNAWIIFLSKVPVFYPLFKLQLKGHILLSKLKQEILRFLSKV